VRWNVQAEGIYPLLIWMPARASGWHRQP